ncbi:MAG: hypothetical protein EA406_10505, partial [Rhodospirillales bacterium]
MPAADTLPGPSSDVPPERPPHPRCRPDPALLAGLRAQIRRLEHHAGGGPGNAAGNGDGDGAAAVLSLGAASLDDALPWGGLPRAGLHDIIAADMSAAAAGFTALLLGRLLAEGGAVAWCRRARAGAGRMPAVLYAPGLARFGLDPDRLIVVEAGSETDLLWALEEGLRSGALAGVAGEIGAAPPIALRRLQLAAETTATLALLVRPARTLAASTPALTRWQVGSVPGLIGGSAVTPHAATAIHPDADSAPPADPVHPRWRVELLRWRASATAPSSSGSAHPTPAGPASWLVEWHETRGLSVAA